MGKAIALLAAGLFVVFMGLRAMAGYETEVEHLYDGEMVTIVCRDGNPVDGRGMDMLSAKEKCADENRGQNSSSRTFLAIGLLLVGWGAWELRKARS